MLSLLPAGDDTLNRRIMLLSSLAGLLSLCALVAGVIPAIKFSYYDVSIGYFDLIQFIPELEAVMAVTVMSSVIMSAVFAYIKVIPRIVCVVMSALASTLAIVTSVTLNIGVVYSQKKLTPQLYGETLSTGGLNYGVEYSPIIIIFILLLLASLAAACASYLTEQQIYTPQPQIRTTAKLRKPDVKSDELKVPENLHKPDDL